MAAEEDDEKLLRAVALKNAQSILAARQRAERELIESNKALERRTEELAQANRRLILLNRMANELIIGAAPQDQLKAALAAVAREIGATHYFQYSIDEKEPGIRTLGASIRPRSAPSGGSDSVSIWLAGLPSHDVRGFWKTPTNVMMKQLQSPGR
jgi:hypothetical protein